tara:strand:- start:797 stop:1021 length:225 start_codon:yes stop_codon:yes gene_type:complete
MNEDQIQILAEAFGKALEIINRNQLKVIDEKFDAIIDGKGEADEAEVFSEERIRTIATEEAENVVEGCSISIDV